MLRDVPATFVTHVVFGIDDASASASHGGGRQRQGPLEAIITSAARSIGSQIGRQLLRGVLGSLTRR